MKNFYSCVDCFLATTQPIQNLVMREKAKRAGGAVSFYGSEDPRAARAQSFILPKLLRTPGIDGVIFFSLEQFRLGDRPNIPLMREILERGYELHFAKEDISMCTAQDLERWLDFILVIDFAKRRDKSEWWRRIVNETPAVS